MQLTKWATGNTANGFGDEGILLIDGEGNRTLSLRKTEEGQISFLEECDGYFGVAMSKEQAIAALEEAIAWIKEA